MKPHLTLSQSRTHNSPINSFSKISSFHTTDPHLEDHHLLEILFISSYPPRECGIATYTQDLINALNHQFQSSFKTSICALETEAERHIYKQMPKYILNTEIRNSFMKTAFHINKDEKIKVVVIQHEFGFFANKEREFKQFYDSINKPIVFVFHTVLSNPNNELKTKVSDMAAIASAIIVMTHDAAAILKKEYDIETFKISVIQHGTHLVPPLNRNKLKYKYQILGKMVLSTFGLLGRSKSIETTLDALPRIIEKFPSVLFLVLGKTHPSVLKNEGEQYRNMLENKVKELELENHVRFVNEYLELSTLLEYLQLTDIYLFTSKDPNQAVSGTFSYAVSCGCPVISTPIPHAKEVLKDSEGLVFEFENSGQLSQAIISLLDNDKLRENISLNSFHKMASTAWQNSSIAHALLFKQLTSNTFQLNYAIPELNLEHFKKMTSRFGMFQFAQISNPDIHSGYTLDDNSRALIAICQHYELYQNETDLRLIHIYLKFIKYCMQPNGTFLNYVNEQTEFTQQNGTENLEDSTGRAIWALGYTLSLIEILPNNVITVAEDLFESSIQHIENIHSTRAMAFIIKGLHYQNKIENRHLLEIFANRLVQMYKHEKTAEWFWFEDYLTYGNSVLPEALLCAHINTHNDLYRKIAIESFAFLISKIFIDGKIKVISNKGWHKKNDTNKKPIGGEQPIDVSYTIIALETFYNYLKKNAYKQNALIAFNWFLGDNHLHQIVYNPCTGGCYDGVEEFNVNLNQGAESTISYLMARLVIERLRRNAEHPSTVLNDLHLLNAVE